ncbi:DUF3137 domain-containing protein [Thermodesulfobacteriota bacterium]
MKTLAELGRFYNRELLDDLKDLEKQRKKLMPKIVLSFGLIFTVAGGSFVGMEVYNWHVGYVIAAWSLLFVVMFPILKELYAQFLYFKSEFKHRIIERIVKFLDDNLQYDEDDCIPESEFKKCRLFTRDFDEYEGDDLVSGKIDRTEFRFSDIYAYDETEGGKGGKKRTTIFKGLFYVADFNKRFSATTVVLPDTAERLFGRLGKKLQSWHVLRDKLVNLEDPEFEKHFVVYSEDQIQARYVLSTSLMKRILDFKKKIRKPVYFSFQGSKMYVAISYKRRLFEPRSFGTLVSFPMVREYYEDLQLALGIAEDLNLNRRIWSKQDAGTTPREPGKGF